MRICLVANEILGAHRNGGIGTATSHLALLLAQHRHSVTLLYVGSQPLEPLTPWTSRYQKAGVAVVHYPHVPPNLNPAWMGQPVAIFERLLQCDFDVILFQDWKALGHACMVAKRAGIAFANTTLAVIAHSSTSWILEANRSFPATAGELATIHMEQQSVELADAVVSPSRYLIEWMKDAGWKLPRGQRVLPYALSGASLSANGALEVGGPPLRPRGRRNGPAHLAFFGRLEERKGIRIFLAALAAEELRSLRFKLSFLGRPSTMQPEEIRSFLADRRPDLLDGLTFQSLLATEEAQAYLVSTGAIAVMPSPVDNSPCVIYEALRLGIPFIAASSGGSPELIDAADRERCLFEPAPQPLARKLREVLTAQSWPPPRPSFEESKNAAAWVEWFEGHAPGGLPEKAAVPPPHGRGSVQSADSTEPRASASGRIDSRQEDICVVVTHFERPHLAEQTLRALGTQTDRSFHVVLVDDGSQSRAALNFLERAGRGIAGLDIDVVRQHNRYLGAARNAGVRRACGEFVIFLDDDNIPFPNMIEVFRRAILRSGADIVTCQMQFFHEPAGTPSLDTLVTGERWAFPGGPAELGAIRNCFGDATAIYRRDVFDRIGGFHEIAGVTHEDWQLLLRASLEGLNILSLPVPLFWYRVTPGSMSRTTHYGANMGVVASAIREKMPRNLARMVDLMIGAHPPGGPS